MQDRKLFLSALVAVLLVSFAGSALANAFTAYDEEGNCEVINSVWLNPNQNGRIILPFWQGNLEGFREGVSADFTYDSSGNLLSANIDQYYSVNDLRRAGVNTAATQESLNFASNYCR